MIYLHDSYTLAIYTIIPDCLFCWDVSLYLLHDNRTPIKYRIVTYKIKNDWPLHETRAESAIGCYALCKQM